MKRMQRGKISK